MKVKMLLMIAGSRNGVAYPPAGEKLELPDSEAAKLCDAGFAEPVVEEKAEKATPRKQAEKRG